MVFNFETFLLFDVNYLMEGLFQVCCSTSSHRNAIPMDKHGFIILDIDFTSWTVKWYFKSEWPSFNSEYRVFFFFKSDNGGAVTKVAVAEPKWSISPNRRIFSTSFLHAKRKRGAQQVNLSCVHRLPPGSRTMHIFLQNLYQ